MKKSAVTSPCIASLCVIILFVLFVATGHAKGQVKSDSTMAKMECCVMKDGKMMHMKDSKMKPMSKDMTMKNGTVCMVNGECVMMDGKKRKMKEGECMDMNGTMATSLKELAEKQTAEVYVCPMHADVMSDKPAQCSKCGMALVKKK